MNRYICNCGHSYGCAAALLLLILFSPGLLHTSLLNTGRLWGSVLTPLRLPLFSGTPPTPIQSMASCVLDIYTKISCCNLRISVSKARFINITPLNLLLLLYVLSQAETAPVTQDGHLSLLPIQQSHHHINSSLPVA